MSGALDCFPQNRRTLFENAEALINYGADESERVESGQLDLFGGLGEGGGSGVFAFKPFEEYSAVARLEGEREFLGLYVSMHPADVFLGRSYGNCMYVEDALALANGAAVSITALCVSARAFTDKNGSMMAFADFEDASGQTGAVIFADKLRASGKPRVGIVYCIKARVSIRDGKRSLQIENMKAAAELPEKPLKRLYVKLDSETDPKAGAVKSALLARKGITEALICFADTRRSRGIRGLRGVCADDRLLAELGRICGAENVVLK